MENRGCVCVVDDAVPFLEGFTRVLAWGGYRVAAYTTAERAFEDIQSEDADIEVVVTDVIMPGLTGLELVQKMRGAGCNKPVVLMSEHLDEDTRELAKEFGVEEFIRKPFTPEEIFGVLDRIMKNGKVGTFSNAESILDRVKEIRDSLGNAKSILEKVREIKDSRDYA